MKILKLFLAASVFLLVFSVVCTSSGNDFDQDLGRHIKIGEIISKTGQVAKINYFSYTNKNFGFVNHHWLSEVVFYRLSSMFGLNSLFYLKVIVFSLCIALVFLITLKRSGLIISCLSLVVFLPFFYQRSFIRPEMFGYLLFSLLLWIFYEYPKKRKLIYLTPLIMCLWVNLHISFIFGLLIILLIAVKTFRYKYFYPDFLVIIISFASTLINPNFIKGAVYPLTVFSNHAYPNIETQSAFFLNRLMISPFIRYAIFLGPLILTSSLLLTLHSSLTSGFLLVIFYIAALAQTRHLPFFSIIAIISFGEVIFLLSKIINIKNHLVNKGLILILIFLSVYVCLNITNGNFSNTFDNSNQFGINFDQNAKKGVDFLLRNRLPANIFNNFDIGGYLIYRLYPKYELFIDNRPEAYPSDFIKNIYIKYQLEPENINGLFDKYRINTVFFEHADNTDWAKIFISTIYKNKKWKLVYLDSSTIIFSRNTNLKDVKNDEDYFSRIITEENNYRRLFNFMNLLNVIEKPQYSTIILNKISYLNPSSCALKRINYYQYQNTPYFYISEEIKKSNWYCF